MFLHDAEELHNDLRARSDKDLAFSGLFGVVDSIESIIEDASFDHRGRFEILSSMVRDEVSAREGGSN